MATLAGVQAAVDNWIANRWPTIQAKAATYLANHPNAYFQGIRTPWPTPQDGATAVPDWTLRPSYQAARWQDFANLPTTPLPGTVRIDQYDGPQGKGYVLSFEVVFGGARYRRSVQVGPETWRAQAWTVLPTHKGP